MLNVFFQAHCEDTGFEEGDERMTRIYCQNIVKKIFNNIGGDFENPTEQDIKKSLEGLASFSEKFRDLSIIEKHYQEIMKLVKRL